MRAARSPGGRAPADIGQRQRLVERRSRRPHRVFAQYSCDLASRRSSVSPGRTGVAKRLRPSSGFGFRGDGEIDLRNPGAPQCLLRNGRRLSAWSLRTRTGDLSWAFGHGFRRRRSEGRDVGERPLLRAATSAMEAIPPAWRGTCFLPEAVERRGDRWRHGRQRSALLIPEGAGSVPAGFLFNGALSTYEKLGFVATARSTSTAGSSPKSSSQRGRRTRDAEGHSGTLAQPVLASPR